MSRTDGLSESEALARRARGQGNDIALRTDRSYARILYENVFTFMNNTKFGLGMALAVLGRVSEGLLSVGVVMANTLVGLVQEVRAKRALDRITLLTRPTATVVREGKERSIDPSEIVLGDILAVRPGDQVVVDGQIVGPEGARVEMDESLLSGEADPVAKRPGDTLYSGSFCVAGSVFYEAKQVGVASLANQIASGARAFRRLYTPLQRQVNQVIRISLVAVVCFELGLALDAVVRGIPLAQAVARSVVITDLVPNGLVLAVAMAYALGAIRMAGQGVLVQHANAVESLSNVDVLCLDKTGTLTANQARLEALHPVSISEADLRRILGDYVASTQAANRTTEAIARACAGQPRRVLEEVHFSSARKWSALAFDGAGQGAYVLGAPEALGPGIAAPQAGDAASGEPAQADPLQRVIEEWTGRGLRVLLLAHCGERRPLHDPSGEPHLPAGLRPLGLVGLADELRHQVPQTLQAFAQAGVTLKIISGDHPTAVAVVARQAGLGPDIGAVSGLDLASLPAEELAQVAQSTTVFGRTTPQQKEALVTALQSRGHYVAMIGDGVNDVLSLRRADLGIALQSGSQAARGIAGIVLLRDSFAALPRAFMEGQRILNGMQAILELLLTRVVYAALLIVAVGLAGGFPFAVKHNSVLTLLTVGVPTIALASWAKPGACARSLRVRQLLRFVLPAALTIAAVGLGIYLLYARSATGSILAPTSVAHDALAVAQSALTTYTVFCGLLLIPFAASLGCPGAQGDVAGADWRPNALAVALLGAYGAILAIPPLRGFFNLALLAIADYLLIGGLALASGLALYLVWHSRLGADS